MRDILIDFRDNMVSRGTISQNDILSLESMIGENIITDQKSINYFTQDSTQVGTQEVQEILDKKIESIDVANAIDMQTFLDTTRRIITAQKYVKNFVQEKIGGLPQEIIDFFQDPKYAKLYVNSDKGQELVEAVNEPLFGLVMFDSPFIIKLKEVIAIDQDKFEEFKNDINGRNIKEDQCQYEPLLNHLLNGVVEPLTFGLLLKVRDNMDSIVEKIDNSISNWEQMNKYESLQGYIGSDGSFDKRTLQELKDDEGLFYKSYESSSFTFLEKFLELFQKQEEK